MGVLKTTLNPSQRLDNPLGEKVAHFSYQLLEKAHIDTDTVMTEFKPQLSGFSTAEDDSRAK